MACSIDHSKLIGLKFCTECGAALEPAKRICAQGHELVRNNKFCEVCGSPEASSASAPIPTPPPISPIPPASPLPPSVTPLTARVVLPPPPINTTPTPHYDPLLPPPPAYSPPKNKNMIAIIASASAALLLIVAVLVNANKVSYTTVEVSMSIYDQDCWDLSWGYYDIPGGEVVLSVDGVETAWADYPSVGTDEYLACTFETTFFDVPMNGEMYEFSMASGRRGTITKTRSELEADGWAFNLSLGL